MRKIGFTLIAAASAAFTLYAEPLKVTLTFDDGLKAHLTEVAPILEKHGWHGIFNVVIERVGKDGKYLSWDEVRELKKRGHEIGNHSWSHKHMTKLGEKDLKHEIVDSQEKFKKELGEGTKYFCHPFTQTDDKVESAIRAAEMEPFTTKRFIINSKAKPGNWHSPKANIERELGKKGRAEPMDILFHGVSPTSGGWEAMTGADDFEKMMDEVAALEQSGRIKVVSYGEYLGTVNARKAAAEKEAKKIRVACIGDSITLGHMIKDPQIHGYPAQLNKLLQEKFPDRYKVQNFGNGGRGTFLDAFSDPQKKVKRGYYYVPQYKQALQWKPQIVICNLGANDVVDYTEKGEAASAQYRKDYMTVLAAFREVNPKVKFYIWTKMSPLTERHFNYGKPQIGMVEKDLEAIARDLGATPVDMYTPLHGKEKSLLFHDGIHPNAAGAKVIADATLEVLMPELTKPQKQ